MRILTCVTAVAAAVIEQLTDSQRTARKESVLILDDRKLYLACHKSASDFGDSVFELEELVFVTELEVMQNDLLRICGEIKDSKTYDIPSKKKQKDKNS